MKRQNPLGSPIGMFFTCLFLIMMGVWLWRGQGLAFSPGQVSEKSIPGVEIQGFRSHAEFEKQCVLCHEPLNSSLAEKCVACHSDVYDQENNHEGLHGHMDLAAGCHTCHQEHRGRQFDPSQSAQIFFDHSTTAFSLNWHQVGLDAQPIDCHACHTGELTHGAPDSACVDCHAKIEFDFKTTHLVTAGEKCQVCHDGYDRMRDFEHTSTAYALQGKHAGAPCAGCHLDGKMVGVPQVCQDCHSEPGEHAGLFEQDCAACHTPQGWQPAQLNGLPFDHATSTAFSLALHAVDYQGNPINCLVCHVSSPQESADLHTCVNCHAAADPVFMQEHQIQFGSDCLVCHDGIDRMSGFSHAQVFVLDGRHAEIQCQGCHIDTNGQPLFASTPRQCAQCHAEPQIHAGSFGIQCQVCHTTEAWSPASLHEHTFPIDHGVDDGNPPADCQTCHPADYVTYTCYGCHEHQPVEMQAKHEEAGVTAQELPDCIACHITGTKDDQ